MLKQVKENIQSKFAYEIGDLIYSVDEKKNIVYEHRIYKREFIKTEEVVDNAIIESIHHVYNNDAFKIIPTKDFDKNSKGFENIFDSREEAEIYLRNKLKIDFIPTETPEWAIKLRLKG